VYVGVYVCVYVCVCVCVYVCAFVCMCVCIWYVAFVDWEDHNNVNEIPDWSPREAGTTQTTPDLASLVQEVIDKPGWAPGNGMAFIISGTGEQHAFSYDGSPSLAPKLIIAYTISALSESGTLVSHGDDDADEETVEGVMKLDDAKLKIGKDPKVGLRFLVGIPSDEDVVLQCQDQQYH